MLSKILSIISHKNSSGFPHNIVGSEQPDSLHGSSWLWCECSSKQGRSCMIFFSDLPSEDMQNYFHGIQLVTSRSQIYPDSKARDIDPHLLRSGKVLGKNVRWEKLLWPSLENVWKVK